MTSLTIIFIEILSIILSLATYFLFSPHNPYQEKNSAFEGGFRLCLVSRGAFKRDSKPVFAEDFYSPREFRRSLSRCMEGEVINYVANIIIINSNIKVEKLTRIISTRRRMLKEEVTENFHHLYINKCLDSHYNKQIKELNRISAIKYWYFILYVKLYKLKCILNNT